MLGEPVTHGNFDARRKKKNKTTKELFTVVINRFKPCHNHICSTIPKSAMSLPRNGWADCKQK